MQDSIFLPLEMHQTVPEYAENIIPGRVRFYQKQYGKTINCPPVDNSYKWAGGGFLSTVDDLMKFARASVGGTSIRMIFPSHKVVVILLTNFSQANIGRLSMEIAQAFMSE